MATLAEAPVGADEQEQHQKEKLFELPRIEIDESNPTAITVAFAGSITLDRSQQADVDFYNRLKSGKPVDLQVAGFVKGPKTSWRRDADGNVDACSQTKSVVIDSVTIVEA